MGVEPVIFSYNFALLFAVLYHMSVFVSVLHKKIPGANARG